MSSVTPLKKNTKGRGCLWVMFLLLAVVLFLVSQKVYFVREHTGFARLLGNEEIIYFVAGGTRMGDHCSLFTRVISFFQWQPAGAVQREHLKVVALHKSGLHESVSENMPVRGSFMVLGSRLYYLKARAPTDAWRPVWVWHSSQWKDLDQSMAGRVSAVFAERNASRMDKGSFEIGSNRLWDGPQAKIEMQGQLFTFVSEKGPGQRRRLTVEGLAGFKHTLIDEDRAWRTVSKGEFDRWFF